MLKIISINFFNIFFAIVLLIKINKKILIKIK